MLSLLTMPAGPLAATFLGTEYTASLKCSSVYDGKCKTLSVYSTRLRKNFYNFLGAGHEGGHTTWRAGSGWWGNKFRVYRNERTMDTLVGNSQQLTHPAAYSLLWASSHCLSEKTRVEKQMPSSPTLKASILLCQQPWLLHILTQSKNRCYVPNSLWVI